jgi:glycosyltransferase involved in cell wall biosynthesis
MKVLLYDETPAYLCHGGKQVQAERLFHALGAIGIEVEYARWWDAEQRGDVIHALGCSPEFVAMARQAGIPVVLSHIMDELANGSRSSQRRRRIRNTAIRRLAPRSVRRLFSWSGLLDVDQLVYMTQADADTARAVYGVSPRRSRVIPHGCDAEAMGVLQGGTRCSASYLVSVASIVPRKNTVTLARAARRARVPVVFLGRPFHEDDAYYREFAALVDGEYVVHPGHVAEAEKLQWLTGASGFVLASRAESGCIAVYEAAAAGLPMLLSDRPWAHSYPATAAIEFVEPLEDALTARLQSFFAGSRRMDAPTFAVATWEDIARSYSSVYEAALSRTEPTW